MAIREHQFISHSSSCVQPRDHAGVCGEIVAPVSSPEETAILTEQRDKALSLLLKLTNHAFWNTGNEPSVSLLARTVDECLAYLVGDSQYVCTSCGRPGFENAGPCWHCSREKL